MVSQTTKAITQAIEPQPAIQKAVAPLTEPSAAMAAKAEVVIPKLDFEVMPKYNMSTLTIKEGEPNKLYQIQSTTDLKDKDSWKPVMDVMTDDTGKVQTYMFMNPANKSEFYRVQTTQ